jgi:hypothetical protein
MAECTPEIIGILELSLIKNEGVRFERPVIGVENEVNFYANGANSYVISEQNNQIKWTRTVNYSGNYKQNYFDEFSFNIHGIENEIPAIINELRNNRLGYIAKIKTIEGLNFVFPVPVFLSKENVKQTLSNSWQLTFSYRIPTFENYLILLSSIFISTPSQITYNCQVLEIIGIKRMGIYINDDVRIRRPNPAIENEVDLIVHGQGSYVIEDCIEMPKWERTIDYSGNYKQNFKDKFTFVLHGINNNVPQIIRDLRNNRLGYIIEIITNTDKSYVFPAPVFLDSENTKPINSHSWDISLSYRVPTNQDRLTKLNTLLMTQSYIIVGQNQILGYSSQPGAIVHNK